MPVEVAVRLATSINNLKSHQKFSVLKFLNCNDESWVFIVSFIPFNITLLHLSPEFIHVFFALYVIFNYFVKQIIIHFISPFNSK